MDHHPVDADRRRRRLHPFRRSRRRSSRRAPRSCSPGRRSRRVVTGVTSPDVYVAPERYCRDAGGPRPAPAVARARDPRVEDPASSTRASLLASSSVTPRANADLLRFTRRGQRSRRLATRSRTPTRQAFTEYKADLDTAQLRRRAQDLERRIRRATRASGQADTRRSTGTCATTRSSCARWSSCRRATCVVRPATGAGQIAPTPKRNAMLGAFLGFLLGLGIAFLWEALDKRVRTEEEIERTARSPAAVAAPGAAARLRARRPPCDARRPTGRRTPRRSAGCGRTSSSPTSTASRGSSWSRARSSGRASRRRSRTSRSRSPAPGATSRSSTSTSGSPCSRSYFDLRSGRGSPTSSSERADLDATLAPIRLPGPGVALARARTDRSARRGGCDVLPAGPLPANPGELVGTQALGRVLDELRADARLRPGRRRTAPRRSATR